MKTADYIQKLIHNFNRIDKKQEKEILEYFGQEIDENMTEQDVWEQTRKIIQNKND